MFLYFRNCYVQKITFRFLIQNIRDNTADLSTMYRDLYIITLGEGELLKVKLGTVSHYHWSLKKCPVSMKNTLSNLRSMKITPIHILFSY